MKFTIDEAIFERYPTLSIGVVVARGIDNTGDNPEVQSLLAERSEVVRLEFLLDRLEEVPKIAAWREAYRSFGAKPKKYRCSVENLYRMILEGTELRHINKVVDIYNAISLKHSIPVGGDDIDKVDGDIRLQFALGDEPFLKLNTNEVDHPKAGEVVYMDEKEVLCRRWNWRECEKSKMTEQSKNVMLVVEGLAPVSKDEVRGIVEELGQLVKKYCGGETAVHILSRDNNQIEL